MVNNGGDDSYLDQPPSAACGPQVILHAEHVQCAIQTIVAIPSGPRAAFEPLVRKAI